MVNNCYEINYSVVESIFVSHALEPRNEIMRNGITQGGKGRRGRSYLLDY